MVCDRYRIPAIYLLVTQQAFEIGTPRQALVAGTLCSKARVGTRHAGKPHAGLGRIVQVMCQCPGGAGQHTLQAIAGKITGLGARLDERDTDAEAILDIRQPDRLDRTDLHTLATLDTGREKVAFVELCILQCARWTQSPGAAARHRDEAGQRRHQRATCEYCRANELTAVLLSPSGAQWRLFRFIGTHASLCSIAMASIATQRPSQQLVGVGLYRGLRCGSRIVVV